MHKNYISSLNKIIILKLLNLFSLCYMSSFLHIIRKLEKEIKIGYIIFYTYINNIKKNHTIIIYINYIAKFSNKIIKFQKNN